MFHSIKVFGHHGVGGGWQAILAVLKFQMEHDRIPAGTSVKYRVMGWLSFMLPKSTKTEEVQKAGW